MTEWKPIETAPKDGTRILLFDKGEKNVREAIVVGYWCGCSAEWFITGCEQSYGLDDPTWWATLLDPPEESAPADAE